MKLYYSKGACSLAVRIIINEIGVPCEFIAADLKAKKTEKGDDYLKINPKGAVPALEIEQGEVLTENAVILQYLADTNHANQLLAPIPDFKRYRILEWLNYVGTELHKTIGSIFNSMMDDHIREKFSMPLIKMKLNFMNKHFENHQYLLGNEFTLPDAYCFVVLNWLRLPLFKLDLNEWPNVLRYLNQLKERPSILKSLQQEKLV